MTTSPDITPHPSSDAGRDRRTGYRSRTPTERAAFGKAARKLTPRAALGEFTVTPDRPDPVDLLVEQGTTRLSTLLPIRYGRMAVSPFTFFRGAALPMASDLAAMSRTGLDVQLCGDAHLLNFGLFGTPERRLVFDINDFDETATGPFEWDVMRLCASIVLASRDRGDTPAATEQAVLAASRAYRQSIANFAKMSTLDVWYSLFDADEFVQQLSMGAAPRKAKIDAKALSKIRTRDSVFAAEKTTQMVDGEPRFVSRPPLQMTTEDMSQLPNFARWRNSFTTVVDSLYGDASTYRHTLSPERRLLFDEYRIVDLAMRVVGVGSVGTRCFIMLLLGRDASDPLILQIKQAEASVLERFTGASPYEHHGERVVVGQKLTQSASDLFLGWTHSIGVSDNIRRDYYLRQFRDWKASIEYTELDTQGFEYYVELCAWALAKAHARSGDQIAIASYVGSGKAFDEAMLTFAHAYADQTVIDHAGLLAAIESGRLQAQHGV